LALKEKSLTKPGDILKHRIPIRTFYTSQERNLPAFIQIDTVGLKSATTSDKLLEAHIWTFKALLRISTAAFPSL
jgi:hypothetical protein